MKAIVGPVNARRVGMGESETLDGFGCKQSLGWVHARARDNAKYGHLPRSQARPLRQDMRFYGDQGEKEKMGQDSSDGRGGEKMNRQDFRLGNQGIRESSVL